MALSNRLIATGGFAIGAMPAYSQKRKEAAY
jgi:hypothetical protein